MFYLDSFYFLNASLILLQAPQVSQFPEHECLPFFKLITCTMTIELNITITINKTINVGKFIIPSFYLFCFKYLFGLTNIYIPNTKNSVAKIIPMILTLPVNSKPN